MFEIKPLLLGHCLVVHSEARCWQPLGKDPEFCPSQPLEQVVNAPSLNFLISKMGIIIICKDRLISALGFPRSCCKDKMQ